MTRTSAAPEVQPLIYVDGVRVQTRRGIEGLDLDPDGIDRVEIVKGAAAVALFGAEASGGVVQIFLKKAPNTADAGGSR